MSEGKASDSSLAGLVRSVMLELPSILERLVYIASLHSPETRDQFCQRFLPLGYDGAKVDGVLWCEHHAIFEDWLGLTLEDKLADLEAYASGRGEAVANIAHQWLSPERRDCLVPRGALPPEKRLFHGDVEMLLMILASKQ